MSKSVHYELKKKYHELLAADPDYPAWKDFEIKDKFLGKWVRISDPIIKFSGSSEYRYNPLPKKWKPKDGWLLKVFKISNQFSDDDFKKLQDYATKLSWLRENGGYDFKIGFENYLHYCDSDGHLVSTTENDCPFQESIYMNEEQSEKWIEMVINGEV